MNFALTAFLLAVAGNFVLALGLCELYRRLGELESRVNNSRPKL